MSERLSYPIGKFARPENLSPRQRAEKIEIIAELPDQLKAIVANISAADLQKTYRPDGWNVQQIVHHLADSHQNAFIRFKWALTEENPTIKPYNQDAWVNLPDVLEVDIKVSVQLLEALHNRFTVLLKSMTETQFSRTYYHPESQYTWRLDQVLALYAWHCAHHLGHLKIALATS